jgi:hypothetical protein
MASSLFSNFFASTATLRDFTHASKLFVDGDHRLAPKNGFLYHVAFNLSSPNLFPRDKLIEAGMLVKSVQLPKYTVETKTYNAYNRANIVQSKIKYDPVNIIFHDDMSDVIRDFWVLYYNYYYGDSQHSASVYSREHKYAGTRPADVWGYRSTISGSLISAIRIYQLYKRRFTEYVLVNPIITGLTHANHSAGSTELAETQMTVTYETVKYATGSVTSDVVSGFGDLHYDQTPSPNVPSGGGILPVGDGTRVIAGDLSDRVIRGTNIDPRSISSLVATPSSPPARTPEKVEDIAAKAEEKLGAGASSFFPGGE